MTRSRPSSEVSRHPGCAARARSTAELTSLGSAQVKVWSNWPVAGFATVNWRDAFWTDVAISDVGAGTAEPQSSLISQSILYADQVQSARRRRRSRRGPLTGSKNSRDIFGYQRLLAQKQKCPDQITNHVMKKAVTAYLVDEFVALRKPSRGKYRSQIGGVLIFPALRINRRK